MYDSDRTRHTRRWARIVLFAAFAVALMFGCMPYELKAVLDGPQGKPLSISPNTTVVIAGNTVNFAVEGGIGPYVYAFVSGSGTGTIDSAGVFHSTSPGIAVIRVTDKTGKSVDATVTVQTAAVGLTISPTSITVSVGQTFTFTGIGGTGPYTWTIPTPGSGSPVISPTGVYVAGNTPNTTDVVRLTDATAAFVTATVTVKPPVVGLTISPTAISLSIGSTVTFGAMGGTGPYTWTIPTHGSGFPSISPSGVYVAGNTPGTDVVRLTDSTAAFVTATVTVTPLLPLAISPTAITLSIGSTVTFVGIGGTAPYTWTIQTPGSGSPAISPTGVYVAGNTPNTTDVVRLTDATAAFVTATVTVTPLSSVDYTITGTALSGTGTVATAMAGGQTFALKNIGTGIGTVSVNWTVYLSANTVLDGGDSVVASGTTPALGAGASNLAVPVVPGSFPAVAPGPYYLIVQITSADDTTPANNTSAAIPITLNPQNIDYIANPVSSTGPLMAGGAMTGDFTIKNQGSANSGATVFWQVRASADTTFDATDYIIAGGTIAGGLNANTTSAPINFSGSWPSLPGPWYLLAAVVSADDINNLNNVSVPTLVTTTGVAPANVDYVVSSVTNGGGATTGKAISGSFIYTNNGTSAGAQSVYWTAYVSADTTLQLGTDPVIDSGTIAPLGATTSSAPVPFTGTWPAAPGTWHLIVSISSSDDLVPTNNVTSSGAVAVTPPNVDYTVLSVMNTGSPFAGDPLSGNFTYRNAGLQDGSQSVVWTAYLSTDAILQVGTDAVIDSGVVPALTAGTASLPISFHGTWPSPSANWFIIVALTVAEDVNPGNNVIPNSFVTLQPPVDYTVNLVSNIGPTTAGGPLAGTMTLANIGGHAGTQFVPWRAYVSTSPTLLIGTPVLVGSGFLPSPGLAAGANSGPIPIIGTWPSSSTTQSYYIIVEVGAGDDLNAGNNDGISALVAVTAPNIDYMVIVVNNTGGTSAGGPIAGNFTLHNNGVANGVSTINWAVHVSADPILQVTDPIIATGSSGPLLGGANLTGIAFAGTWPVTAGTWYLIVEANAADDTNPLNNWTASLPVVVTSLAPNYVITGVPLPTGTQTGLAVSGNFTVQNTGTAAGVTTVNWEVYASLGNNTYNAGDTLIAAGSFGPLGISGTSSPGYAGTWPATPGTYYIIVRVSTADDAAIADVASAAILVAAPPAPDYTATFNAAIPWSGLVGTAMSLTGTPQMTIQNLSVNPGHQTITWAVYLSKDNVLDAGDTLVQQGTVGPLAGSGTTPVSFAGNWPAAPGQLYFLIATVQATDDSNVTNNVVIAQHACAIGDYRYVEGAENNSGVGPNPPAGQTSNMGVTTLGANQTIAIEGVMDAYVGAVSQYDTYKFTTVASMSKLSMRAMWGTGYDDIDLYLWDTGSTDLNSIEVGINSEPGAGTFDVTSVTPRICYISANFWLANNTSGSGGQKYVILVRGLP